MLPFTAPLANLVFGEGTIDQIGVTNHLNIMKEAIKRFIKGDLEIKDQNLINQGKLNQKERSGILQLHALLDELDPNHELLGLKRIPTYSGDYLWLCPTHFEKLQPKIPEQIS